MRIISPWFCPISSVVAGVPAARLAQFKRVAIAGASHPAIRAKAAELVEPSGAATAAAVLAFVQSLPYHADPSGLGGDWLRPPCRTMVEGGDCDCLATLCGALDHAAGLRWRLAWVVNPRAALDHVAAQVWVAGRWAWQECTIAGARVGEHPRDAVARLGGAWKVEGR